MMSEGVHLRDVEAGDLPVLYQHQLDPDAIRLAVVNPRTAEAFNTHWQKILGDPSVIAKAVVLDGAVVL